MRKKICLALLLTSSAAATAHAATGLYVGAAPGEANTQYGHIGFDIHDTDGAWKLFAGFRPLGLFGAELGYVDFGRASASGEHSATRGADAMALAYLPIPLLDIYGKLGLMSWWQNSESALLAFHRSGANVAYGGGVGTHFGALGLRVEYERFQLAADSKLSLTSLGVSWNFL